MSKENQDLSRTTIDELFNRIVSILEKARSDVVRAVNSNMVIAYWLIGREILHEIQGGTKRATYGKQIIAQLSEQLTVKYGPGFSVANLRNFRQFYEMYPDRLNHYPMGSELDLKEKHFLENSEHTNEFSPLLSYENNRPRNINPIVDASRFDSSNPVRESPGPGLINQAVKHLQ